MRNLQNYYAEILEDGVVSTDRTGVGTIAQFGKMLRWDLSKGFPAQTTKKLAWRAVVGELIWFLRGSTDLYELKEIMFGSRDSGRKTIWDANYEKQGKALGYENGYMGPIYGAQWRDFGTVNGIDQIQQLIHELKNNPDSRRHLVTAWNPEEIDAMTLPPCHYGFQCWVRDGKLSLMWNQRSVDSFLGLPFNIASYALLTHILARLAGLEVGELIFVGGDCHIYNNHLDQVREVLTREVYELPSLEISSSITSLESLEDAIIDDFKLVGYKHHDTIKAEMAV